MANTDKNSSAGAALFCAAVLAATAAVLIIPQSNAVFRTLSSTHPFAMGFVKFVFLATTGELIAARISKGCWFVPASICAKALVWGIIGVVLALLLKVYAAGTANIFTSGIFPCSNKIVIAFATSTIMNLTFAPVMMISHKFSDTWLALRNAGKETSLASLIDAIDWKAFYSFVILKTIPFFWIPAHTITFSLPSEYQTVMAALLSIALGVFLSLKNKR